MRLLLKLILSFLSLSSSLYAIWALSCIVIGGYFVMAMITNKNISNEAQDTYKQNLPLQNEILSTSKEKIDILDRIIKTQSHEDKNEAYKGFDCDKLTDGQKSVILQIIPNGNPLDLFEMKQKSKRRLDSNPLKDNHSNTGYDYYTPSSEPVLATAVGVVDFIRGNDKKYGYKNLVRIVHAQGFSTIYMNLDKIKVKKGDFVSKGDVLGFSTASSSKNHISLYYEVRFLDDVLDTSFFVNWDKRNFSPIFELSKDFNIDLKSFILALNDVVNFNEEYMDMYKHNKWFIMMIQAKNKMFDLVGARFDNLDNAFMEYNRHNMTIMPQDAFNDSCELAHDYLLSSNAECSITNNICIISVNAVQKSFMMKFIPNGRPLEVPLVISSLYGKRRHPILHIYRMHNGVDIIAPVNTPVYATADGVVDLAKSVDNGGYGKLVKISHSFGFQTLYAHLNSLKVKKGEFVKKGQLIAFTGSTGISTGAHLHYEIRFLGNSIEPMNFVSWGIQNFNLIFDKERTISWHSLLESINNLMEVKQIPQQLSHPILSLKTK